MKNFIRKTLYSATGYLNILTNYYRFKIQRDSDAILLFDTAMDTDNLGDYIIMKYCHEFLEEYFSEKDFHEISTHQVPSKEEILKVKQTKYKFVCGTNLLTSHIEEWWNWRLPDGYRGKKDFRNVILLGAGWGTYQDKCSDYSKLIYKTLLTPNILHSVRDCYTENKLKEIGINNILNTGCPTMWRLTPEFCKTIPSQKAEDVVTTLTDYRRDIQKDNFMLNVLHKNYRRVYLWIQGKKDLEYADSLNLPENVIIVPRDLCTYEKILKQGNLDYVGTRLHAGIYALNHKVRSLIIAVDNRAIEIAKDTNLPIILRDDIEDKLENEILKNRPTNIKIKTDNIQKFKEQFELRGYGKSKKQ